MTAAQKTANITLQRTIPHPRDASFGWRFALLEIYDLPVARQILPGCGLNGQRLSDRREPDGS